MRDNFKSIFSKPVAQISSGTVEERITACQDDDVSRCMLVEQNRELVEIAADHLFFCRETAVFSRATEPARRSIWLLSAERLRHWIALQARHR